MCTVLFLSGRRLLWAARRARRGEQVPHLAFGEASEARHGPQQSGAADLHSRASQLPRQALGLLLPRRCALEVSGAKALPLTFLPVSV